MRWIYAKTVWVRAVRQTWRDSTGSTWPNRIVQVLLFAAPLASAFTWHNMHPKDPDSGAVLNGAEFTAAAGLAGLGAVMLLFFLWHLIVAVPYQLWREEKERADAQPNTPDYLNEILARRKAEFIADAIAPRRSSVASAERIAAMHSLMPEPERGCPEMPIWQAVEHVRSAIGDDDFHKCYAEARQRIRQVALEKKLEIWGRKEIAAAHLQARQEASAVWSRIDADYWQEHELTPTSISEHSEGQSHTWTEADKLKTGDRYWSLRVREAEVQRLWSITSEEIARRQEQQQQRRRELIASGRDLVQNYRSERMPEPFSSWIGNQRPYLDLKPHLSREYWQHVFKRERPDTPAQRDLDSGDFEAELARLEKEWAL